MPKKKKQPATFDGWLGKVIDDETETTGRATVAEWIGVSEQSVNRRARGEVPYLAREVEIIAEKINIPTAELVGHALRRFGGIDKLLAEYGPKSEGESNVTATENVTYLGHVKAPLNAAADDDPRTSPKD